MATPQDTEVFVVRGIRDPKTNRLEVQMHVRERKDKVDLSKFVFLYTNPVTKMDEYVPEDEYEQYRQLLINRGDL